MTLDAKSLGTLVDEAVILRDRMKADGLNGDELEAAFERTIRAIWTERVFTREWHPYCDLCSDTGLRIMQCRRGQRCSGISTRTNDPHDKAGKYRRLCKLNPTSDYEHAYSEPCGCPKGDQFREKPKTAADYTEAGKVPVSKPTRFGR